MMSLLLYPIAETLAHDLHYALSSTGQTRPQRLNAVGTSSSGDKFEQGGSMQCIVFFNLVKLNIHNVQVFFETELGAD